MTTVGRCGFWYRRAFSSIVSTIAAPAASEDVSALCRINATRAIIRRDRRGRLRTVSRPLVASALGSLCAVRPGGGRRPCARCRVWDREPGVVFGRKQSGGTDRRCRHRRSLYLVRPVAPGGANTGFEVGDACRLPYAGSSFDAALAQLSLNFVPDP